MKQRRPEVSTPVTKSCRSDSPTSGWVDWLWWSCLQLSNHIVLSRRFSLSSPSTGCCRTRITLDDRIVAEGVPMRHLAGRLGWTLEALDAL